MNRIIRTVTAILLCGMLCCPVVEAQGRRPGRTEHNTVNNNHGGRPGGSSRPNRPGNGGSHNPGNNNPGRPNRPGNGGSHNPGRRKGRCQTTVPIIPTVLIAQDMGILATVRRMPGYHHAPTCRLCVRSAVLYRRQHGVLSGIILC